MTPTPSTHRRYSWLLTGLRVLLGLGLLALIFTHITQDHITATLVAAAKHRLWLAAGLALTGLGLLAGAWRWHIILAAQSLTMPGREVFRVYFVAQFFNAFMLGACGGDVVRAYYAARHQPTKKAEAAATILVDRALGLFIMIMFCCLTIPLRLHLFLDNEGPRATGILMLIFLVLALGGLTVLFGKNVFEHFALFQKLETNRRFGPLIRRAYEALFLYRSHHKTLLAAALLSLVNLAGLTLACNAFGRALGLGVSTIDYFTLFPIVSVLSALPITPGSLGVREGLFVSLFSAVFVAPGPAMLLSLLVYAGGLSWSLFGGLLYITTPTLKQVVTESHAPAPPP